MKFAATQILTVHSLFYIMNQCIIFFLVFIILVYLEIFIPQITQTSACVIQRKPVNINPYFTKVTKREYITCQ
jgi:hypothetical protein